MSKRLVESKRIRSVYLEFSQAAATGVIEEGVGAEHVFQDDVTIVGAQLSIRHDVEDAKANADGEIYTRVELSRQATLSKPGAIMMARIQQCWTGLFTVGGNLCEDRMLMFPDGMGIEVDEGEAINLLYYIFWIGASGDFTPDAKAIVYYVER